jgi:hypothetical protein
MRGWEGRKVYERDVYVSRLDIAFFADALGLVSPTYYDVTAARMAGFPDVPAPRSFYLSLATTAEMARPRGTLGNDGLGELGVPPMGPARALGGGSAVLFHRQMHAGETVRVTCTLEKIYTKTNRDQALLIFLEYGRVFEGLEAGVAVTESLTRIRMPQAGGAK